MAKSTIFGFLGGLTWTQMGVLIYMYLNIPQIIFIPNIYIYGFWFNSLGSSVLLIYHFWHFSLTREGKRYGQVGRSPCYFQSEVVYAYQV